jgi:hypothetical protein
MAVNLHRWLKYAKAKLDASVASGNEELDRLEAEQKAKAADKPWLAAQGDAPTVDEAAARIRWESEEAERNAKAMAEGAPNAAPGSSAAPPSDVGGATATPDATPSTGAAPAAPASVPGPLDPADAAEAAQRSAAQLELEARAKESADRLDQIRAELGIDAPKP